MKLRRAVALATAAALLLAATASAVAQPSPSPDGAGMSGTDLRVHYPAGNARTFAGGEQNVWSIHMSQSLQPRGPHEAGSVESSMDLELTESVEELGDGRVELTLEVTDAQAFGFQAGKEESEALGRRLTAVYDGKSLTMPDSEQSFEFFGSPGAIHMADVALKAHVAAPVLPDGDYTEGDELGSEAVLPAGWSRFSHRLEGTTTVGASQQRRGAELVGLTSTQSAGTEISLPSLDNPVETIQGGEADLNEFFLATMFKVLVPPGTDPQSLLPDFPMQIGDAHVHDHAPRRRKRASRRRFGPALLACSALLAMGGCASHPQFAGVATSIGLDGPIEFQQKASLHQDTGILVHSATEASAALTGTTIRPNDEARADLGERLWALTGLDVALDAGWTIEQVLISELPPAEAERQEGSDWTVAAGLAALAALAIGLLVRRAA